MNAAQLINPVRRTIASIPPVDVLTQVGVGALLGWVGLTRRQSRLGTQTALVAVGALFGAGAALLLTPSSGQELRSRVGKGAGATLGGAVGKVLGEQAGAHPMRTAKVVDTVKDVVGKKQT